MSMPLEKPLTVVSVADTQSSTDSAPYNLTSVSDANENVVGSKDKYESIEEPEKAFDFLVWNHESNKEEAGRIYEQMEKLGLRGYIYDRDKIIGQYKLTAIEQAIRNTANIILMISTEALGCGEFSRKMHASTNYNVIPIYVGLPKSKYPRLLRHHVGIRYENSDDFWGRLHTAITRPRKDSDSSVEVGNLSKPIKKEKEPSPQASQLPRKTTKPIKLVPEKKSAQTATPDKQYSSPQSSRQKSEKKGLFSLFSRKQSKEQEDMSIQMKPI
nr:uncharacterized protein LOC129262254 [Lytechinus pictus]